MFQGFCLKSTTARLVIADISVLMLLGCFIVVNTETFLSNSFVHSREYSGLSDEKVL